MNKIGINNFVLRQVKGSGKSYSLNWSFVDIANHAAEQLKQNKYKSGYRDGVILVNVDNSICD